jgi:hypothetical protein
MGAITNNISQQMDIDSDSESEVLSTVSEGPPSSVAYTNERSMITASSGTSYELDPSTRSSSPMSVISLTDSVRANILYRQEHGRGLNNYCEIYRLPVDDEEFERLGMVARAFLLEFTYFLERYPI